MSAKRTYSCTHCGQSFEANPPDDRHVNATRNEKDYPDNVKVNYKCKNCAMNNTIYWGHQPPIFKV